VKEREFRTRPWYFPKEDPWTFGRPSIPLSRISKRDAARSKKSMKVAADVAGEPKAKNQEQGKEREGYPDEDAWIEAMFGGLAHFLAWLTV